MTFTFKDLEEILKIKDRVIQTMLVGGGAALYNDEKIKLDELLTKAKEELP